MKRNNFFMSNYYIKQVIIFLGMMFSFLIVDVYLRFFSNKYVLIYRFTHASPLFFSISWIFIFMIFFNIFNKKGKIISYLICLFLFNILMISQTLHMETLNRFFGLSDLFLASEGSKYFGHAISKIDLFTIIVSLISLSSGIVTTLIIKSVNNKKYDIYDKLITFLSCLLLFGCFRNWALIRLGERCDISTWEAAYNIRLIYEEFNNQSKNMEVAGIYEQTFRNSYLFINDVLNNDKEKISNQTNKKIKKLENITDNNEYTGLFKDKNLIFILLESIDSFLVNEEVMPTLYKLQQDGWNFTNRYAPVFGGGQTINSEFAANVGLYSIDNSKAIYNYEHLFSHSLPAKLKQNGYIVNSLHMNTGKFYNRNRFHYFLGYENHYALLDMKDIKKLDYGLDSNIIKNDELDKYIFHDNRFMTFITTYSAHLPYSKENKNCNNIYGLDIKDNTEMSCLRNLAKDTDEFIRLLIDKLDSKKMLDDTVLVLFSDHYNYGYSDVDYIMDYKKVDNLNLIQNIPFIIWHNGIEDKSFSQLVDTADIAPTLLNLWGINFDSRYYIGQDAFNTKRDNFIYFSSNNFYDGKLYYDKSTIINEKNEKYINEILNKINDKIDLNKNIIIGNYYYYLDKGFNN